MTWRRLTLAVGEAESLGSEWKGYGLCVELDLDPELWYAKGSSSEGDGHLGTDDEGAKRAKAICKVCPVQIQCLTYALVAKEKHGIWGGMDARERRRYAKAHGYAVDDDDSSNGSDYDGAGESSS